MACLQNVILPVGVEQMHISLSLLQVSVVIDEECSMLWAISVAFISLQLKKIREKKRTFELKPLQNETAKQDLGWLHQSLSHWGSYSTDLLLLPQPTGRSIPGIRPLRSFESTTCSIDMLLFFICWLYLIPSLLFPLTEQRGSYSRSLLNPFFFFFSVYSMSGIGPLGVCEAVRCLFVYLCEICL